MAKMKSNKQEEARQSNTIVEPEDVIVDIPLQVTDMFTDDDEQLEVSTDTVVVSTGNLYKVIHPLRRQNKLIKPGSIIELTESEAAKIPKQAIEKVTYITNERN